MNRTDMCAAGKRYLFVSVPALDRLKSSLALLLSVLWAFTAMAQEFDTSNVETPPPPNIVFIFVDDLGYGDIGAFGATDVSTPNIDALASNGAKFTQFYSASPVCSPSRAALLTGRNPIRMGIHEAFFPSSYQGMAQSEVTIAELLKPAGYVSAIIGKWHLGHHHEFLPLQQGFDEYFGIAYSNDMSPLPMMRGNRVIAPNIDQTELTKTLTHEATDFIKRNTNNPFYLLLAHPMPHVPIYSSNAFEGVSKRGPYGDVIEELDWSVGEIVKALEQAGLANNTLVVFSSDNGPWLVMGDEGGSNGGLRNGKGTTFEGGVRVPTLAQYPGTIEPGRIVDTPLSMLDWLPTFAQFANVRMPENTVIDGRDISGLLRGVAVADDTRLLAFYAHGHLEAVRVGDWKYKRAFYASQSGMPGPLRFILGDKLGLKSHGPLLFNLADDPGEKTNLIQKYPGKAEELRTALEQYESDMGDVPGTITEINLGMSPVMGVIMQSIMKWALMIISALIILASVIFFFLGRWFALRKTRS